MLTERKWRIPKYISHSANPIFGITNAVTKVIPRAIEQGKNVLLVGNRTALLTQMKQALAEIVGFEEFAWLNEIGQQKIEIMGPVAAITYHRLPAFLNDPKNKGWLENVGYMVADEAHFFAADSSFNEKCGFFSQASDP